MAKWLIVNADDFGLTRGVNAGIAQAHMEGIVTSTTLMVNMPGFEDAAIRARDLPALGTGLHLNLTYGRPILPPGRVRSLVNEAGAFVKDPGFVLGGGRSAEMWEEFWAQVRRFLATGLTLSHLDTHHHLHRSERVLDLVAQIARALGVTVRCLDAGALWARGIVPQARFANFYGDQDGSRRLLDIIGALPDGVTETPCHPGVVDEELMAISTFNVVRGRELAALTDPLVREAVRAGGIRLTNYAELRAVG